MFVKIRGTIENRTENLGYIKAGVTLTNDGLTLTIHNKVIQECLKIAFREVKQNDTNK